MHYSQSLVLGAQKGAKLIVYVAYCHLSFYSGEITFAVLPPIFINNYLLDKMARLV